MDGEIERRNKTEDGGKEKMLMMMGLRKLNEKGEVFVMKRRRRVAVFT